MFFFLPLNPPLHGLNKGQLAKQRDRLCTCGDTVHIRLLDFSLRGGGKLPENVNDGGVRGSSRNFSVKHHYEMMFSSLVHVADS